MTLLTHRPIFPFNQSLQQYCGPALEPEPSLHLRVSRARPPLPDLLYYRVKVIDTDGGHDFSETVALSTQNTVAPLTLDTPSPQPADHLLTIRFFLPEAMPVSIMLYSVTGSGSTVVRDREWLARGSHVLPLTTASLASGTYIMDMTAG